MFTMTQCVVTIKMIWLETVSINRRGTYQEPTPGSRCYGKDSIDRDNGSSNAQDD